MATGQATEHSYRPALQALVEGLGGDGVRAVNEPSHVACGAPDFVVARFIVPVFVIVSVLAAEMFLRSNGPGT